ncbi:hypothetical protein QMG83_01055 [Salinibacterium sp. G-O1]|uniref:hypothetical protein n=1 Tax=Salinibacterium sp. G-O1 TaxID=3046208 RepID=UPI0024B9B303|nr:hypothetical protein [Salinibacterium sp. G-O1]MDJ0333804.1 hypothetical protein [Salinibacterium sp. G-O1]
MRKAVGIVTVAVVMLTGCSALGFEPSPTTTYIDEAGTEVTVDWVDYPAYEGIDGERLLGHPDQADLEPVARDLVKQLRTAIADASGYAMTSSEPEGRWFDDDNWHEQGGNGYGGRSMLTTVNCCDLSSEGAPEASEWQRVFDAANQAVQAEGLGEFVLDDPLEWCGTTAEECWRWTGFATDGVQWVSLLIQDGALDPTGDAVREAEELDRPVATIQFGYGATVVPTGRSDEYARALDPFVGLKQPRATASN